LTPCGERRSFVVVAGNYREARERGKGKTVAHLNMAQLETMLDYSGSIVAVADALGEYSDEGKPFAGTASVVTMSSGWVVKVGRYGGVLSEQRG
jgi:hypothetical protein